MQTKFSHPCAAKAGLTQGWVFIVMKPIELTARGRAKAVNSIFDKVIHFLDADAYKVKTFPNWFMTSLSLYGLGFQLLIIAFMLPLGWIEFIAPFFIIYSLLIFVLIGIRKTWIR